MTIFTEIYDNKLLSAEKAVDKVPKKANLAFGLGPSNPPALLSALAERVAAQDVDRLDLYYQLAGEAAKPLFRKEFLDRVSYHPSFLSSVDRAFIKEVGLNAAIDFMPCYLWQLPRVLSDFNHMNVFMITVSPMDRHGYFSLGTSCDYSSTVSRDCDMLIVEVNRHKPRLLHRDCGHSL